MKKAISLILAVLLAASLAIPAFAAEDTITYTKEQVSDIYFRVLPLDVEKVINNLRNGDEYILNLFQTAPYLILLTAESKEQHEKLDAYIQELDKLVTDGLISTDVPVAFMFQVVAVGPGTGWEEDEIPEDNRAILWNNGNPIAPQVSKYGYEELTITTATGCVARFEDLPNYEQFIDSPLLGGVSSEEQGVYDILELEEHCIVNHPGAEHHGNSAVTETPSTPAVTFTDVKEDDYYAPAVQWAVQNNVTNGIGGGLFGADAPLTRAQAVTFLWRVSGCPEPTSAASTFTDVTDPNAYYYKAVLWAVESGITNGVGDNRFGNDSSVTRGQMITFLWRTMGKPGEQAGGEWYTAPESWAKENGLLSGTAEEYTTNGVCPRADVVYYLWRELN